MVLLQEIRLKELIRFKLLTCYTLEEQAGTLVLKTNSPVFPKTQFKEVMIAIGQLVVRDRFHKIILDENLVALLDDSCLEWYHSVWKELMVYNDLEIHCFVIPDNKRW